MTDSLSAEVIGLLRASAAKFKGSAIYKEIVEPRDEVLARFQPIFSPGHAPAISAEEFKSFLRIENNHHWSGLQRQGGRMCSDMAKLRDALSVLLDEERPLVERLDYADAHIHGMGKNTATAILLVAHPGKYGVWNNRSEAQMKRLEIWPAFERGDTFGERYVKVNRVLLDLRDALEMDLWTLDALWWFLDQTDPYERSDDADLPLELPAEPGAAEPHLGHRFGLERHLHQFMRDNWDRIDLGRDWALYSEPGDDEAGYEYQCDVGRIDLLAKHRKEARWLVIELKREQSTDQTIGQLLRYMGWVRQHLAEPKDIVQGMIISREADNALRYALGAVEHVEARSYEVTFSLKPAVFQAGGGVSGD